MHHVIKNLADYNYFKLKGGLVKPPKSHDYVPITNEELTHEIYSTCLK